MRRSNINYLFYDGDLSATLQSYFGKVPKHVDAIPESKLLNTSIDELIKEVVNEFKILPLELDEEKCSIQRNETQVDVSIYRSRYLSDKPGPCYIPGFRLDFSIPFRGDPILWKLKPNHWKSTLPFGEINAHSNSKSGQLTFSVEYPADQSPEAAKSRYDDNMKDIRFYIDSQKTQIQSENARLPQLVKSAVERRRDRLEQQDNLEELFGVPVQKGSQKAETTIKHQARSVSKQPMEHEWDVFISHASEDKEDFVRPLAKLLKEKGLSVWFDEFSLKIGDSLRRSIDKGLDGAKYGIVVISPYFLEKEWPKKELDALIGREVGGKKIILPIWHNVTVEVVRAHSPMLADRVASNSIKGLEGVVAEILQVVRQE